MEYSKEIEMKEITLNSRIVSLSQPNAGISKTRSRGLEAAQTESVALIDADDIMLPERNRITLFIHKISTCELYR